MRAGEFAGRRARAAREDRHGVAEHQHARSGALPHPPRAPSPDRRRVVHLPDVRLRASASDALERITHSLCTLEFEDHRPLYDWLIENLPVPAPAAADRVRAAQPDLHGDEQAEAARARRGEARRRLGRSAHADDRRACAAAATRPRRSAAFCDAHRRRQARERRRRRRCSSTPCARISNRRAPRVMGVLRPLQAW